MQNHIWSEAEIREKMATLYRHTPKTLSDHVSHNFMYTLYHAFNFITGYKEVNPSTKSIQWRLIVLESFAGVPGFLAAGFRHFRSLRRLERDHGWIATLLEEAENERMHLLVCLKMFNATWVTRVLVIIAQVTLTPVLMVGYIFNPKGVHRFVGYLEETACHTYVSVIKHVETPGTHLNRDWNDLPAPEIARGYWKLPADAKWKEVLMCIMADESHHRDVNHTFADMQANDTYVSKLKEDAHLAWRLDATGESGWRRPEDAKSDAKKQ